MKSLVLAEKPSVAKEIAHTLGCNTKGNGYFEGSQYIITWALGHLVTLKTPEDYGDKYKSWTADTLPMIPEKLETKVIPGSKKQFYNIKEIAKRSDINELIIATDAGREGELVARLIMEHIHWKKPFKRLWISSLTRQAIKEGFSRLKPGREYDNLFNAAKCRSEADWLIGLNVTRALTIKYNDQLSAGRVQTPTLSMMVKREQEIRNFRPVPFWTIEVSSGGFTAQYTDKNNNARIFDKTEADNLKAKLSGKTATVKSVVKKEKQENAPLFYDLTELQREANKRYGFTAQKTLKSLQSLYEYHKLVTYPRTDSRYITDDIVPTLNVRLNSLPYDYKNYVSEIIKNKMSVNKSSVNNSKVTDHHALLPTEEKAQTGNLTQEEMKIYNLIVKRFIENFYPPFTYEQVKVTLDIDGENFAASGRTVKDMGWKKVEDRSDGEKSLPELKEGQKFDKVRLELKSSHTEPPPRHTEGTLLTEMEKHCLGTPATRAEIIEKLINVNYVERHEKSLIPTEKGKQIVDIVVTDLRSPDLTSKWEKELENITKGKKHREDFMKDIVSNTERLVKETLQADNSYKHSNMISKICPECGKNLLAVTKKDTLLHTCSDRNCKFKEVVGRLSYKKCKKCHNKMEMKEVKGDTIFVCKKCNIEQKLSEMAEGGRANRRELSSINRKNDEEFKKADNPFSALKDFFN